MKSPIVFWFDPVSPFGYIGSIAIEKVAAKHDREVDWRPLLIGVTIMKVMGMKPLREYLLKWPYLQRDMQRLALYFDVPLKPHGLTGVNSLAACRAFLWINQKNPAQARLFARAIYAKLWTRSEDITPVESVVVEAEKLGLDGTPLRAALAGDALKQALESSVKEAVSKGVFGAPTFIADGEIFWGCDHIWMLEHWLETGGFSPMSAARLPVGQGGRQSSS